MQFTCSSSKLLRGVSVVHGVAQSKIANPIIENILIIAQDNQVTFVGTNLVQTVRCTIEANIQEEGEIAVPSKFIHNLVRELSEGEVQIKTKRNSRLLITCNKNEYRLGGMPAEEFPPFLPLSEGTEVVFTSAEIRELIRKNVFCTSAEKSRFELDGIKVVGHEDKMTFVSTDGKRLSSLTLKRETAIENKVTALIPTRTWQELGRSMPEGQAVVLKFGQSKVMFEVGDTTLLSSLLGDNFPPFEQIIPSQFEKEVIVKRDDLEAAVRRACVLASESTGQVILAIAPGEMLVEGESYDVGKGKDVISIQYEGEPINVSYKGDYILDFIRSVSGEDIVIRINDTMSPAGFQEKDRSDYLHIIMPMKIVQPVEELEEGDEDNSQEQEEE